jgi:hypothetical protein
MRSLVFIFVPVETEKREFESAVRKHLDLAEFIEVRPEAKRATIDDPEQLPLWKWFTY